MPTYSIYKNEQTIDRKRSLKKKKKTFWGSKLMWISFGSPEVTLELNFIKNFRSEIEKNHNFYFFLKSLPR